MQNDELLRDTFITALEGGVNYWATALSYQHSGDFRAVLVDSEEFYEDVDAEQFVITEATIQKGFDTISENRNLVADSTWLIVINAIASRDAGDIDADIADQILQIGALGSVVYG